MVKLVFLCFGLQFVEYVVGSEVGVLGVLLGIEVVFYFKQFYWWELVFGGFYYFWVMYMVVEGGQQLLDFFVVEMFQVGGGYFVGVVFVDYFIYYVDWEFCQY